ncbi:MAG: hypothetical protein Q4G49_09425 [Paracoccus sp. (in: a-proteobacteria)]|nr:hypothetical protein [Paracoccus sp. (in: a-proteobacteria)]
MEQAISSSQTDHAGSVKRGITSCLMGTGQRSTETAFLLLENDPDGTADLQQRNVDLIQPDQTVLDPGRGVEVIRIEARFAQPRRLAGDGITSTRTKVIITTVALVTEKSSPDIACCVDLAMTTRWGLGTTSGGPFAVRTDAAAAGGSAQWRTGGGRAGQGR